MLFIKFLIILNSM